MTDVRKLGLRERWYSRIAWWFQCKADKLGEEAWEKLHRKKTS